MKNLRDKHAARRREETPARIAQEWQRTFDADLDAIWILDEDQRIVRCNKMAQQIFNLSRDEMIGRHCWEMVHG
ncbi:MAG: PAS domain-containing protein, partial [Candidatus Krumholzibacteriaceae bacterium]